MTPLRSSVPITIPLKLCLYLVGYLRYSALNNGVTLTSGVGVVLRSLKMAPTFYWSAIVNIALSCAIFSYFKLKNIATLKSGLEVTQDHSNWYHSKAWVQFPIRLP